jgi:pilus assembly protein FimV
LLTAIIRVQGVRDRNLKLWLVTAAFAAASPFGAYAAGLGKLTVHSTLGQPLNADVELLSVQKGETITARLASPDVYQQTGAQYNNVLTGTRVAVEKRPNGELYLKATTPRPINEPFVDLVIEINSENGRVVRQYTALLDPPEYGRATAGVPPAASRAAVTSAAPAPSRAPEQSAPAAGTASAVAQAPAPSAERPLAPPQQSAAAPARKSTPPSVGETGRYGPVKAGDTLRKIARNVKPEGVSLEQTLVGLYRENPDAFINNNMNLMKTGKILRVPQADALSTVAPGEAANQVRMQVADFNSYRDRLADRPSMAPEEGSLRSGRIGTARVTERGGAQGSQDTVRVSRGEPKGRAGMNTAERLRALEEEVIARDRALADANERISQLEQIIKDTQRAIELKAAGAGAAQKGAEKGGPAAQSGSPVAVAPPVPPVPKTEAPASKATQPEAPAATAKTEAPKESPKTGPAPVAKGEAPAKPKAAPPPEPSQEPSFLATLLEEPLYLAAGGAALLLGGLGFIVARRRRQETEAAEAAEPERLAPVTSAAEPAEENTWDGSAIERAAARAEPSTTVSQDTSRTPPPPPAMAMAAASAARASSDDNDLDFDITTRGSATSAVRADAPQHARSAGDELALEPLPPVNAPMAIEKVSSEPPANLDFKLDLNDLDVNAPSGEDAGRDDHWYDVQQKFDLAKAYEEMGDKGGARDILHEVLREGDSEQQLKARQLLESLG